MQFLQNKMDMLRYVFFLYILILSFTAATARTYVVCVGVAEYKNIPSLIKSERDASTVAEFYRRAGADVKLILGKTATRQNVINALKSFFAEAGTTDRVILFFSGHGFNGGMCPYDIKADGDNALLYKDINKALANSSAAEKFVFVDACYSGALRCTKNIEEAKQAPENIMYFLSSRGSETSMEHALQANGYFTKYLIRGLRGAADSNADRRITAKELFSFVNKKVSAATKNKQHPVMWGHFDAETVMADFVR